MKGLPARVTRVSLPYPSLQIYPAPWIQPRRQKIYCLICALNWWIRIRLPWAWGFPYCWQPGQPGKGPAWRSASEVAEKASARSNTYFAANTLEFLHRGGRIGGGAAFLGTALDLKPILYLHDGRVEAFQKIRTMKKARQRLVEIIDSQLTGCSGVHIAVLHANIPGDAETLMDAIRQKLGNGMISEALITDVSPVIGAHTGPGTIGISFMPGI